MSGAAKNPLRALLAKLGEIFGEVSQGGLTDIRHKLVEEAWFGRVVTPETRDRPGWETLCDQLAQERGVAPDRSPEREHELDP